MSQNQAEPTVATLKPVLGESFVLGKWHVVACAFFGALLVILNNWQLWYTDLWGHVAYGRWILDHRTLPVFDPFMPLASSVRVFNYCWLSQVMLAWAERLGGAEGLSNLFAVTVVARYLILARTCYIQTKRLGLALGGVLLGLILNTVRLTIIRPKIFAVLCGQCLLWVLAAVDPGSWERPQESEEKRVSRWSWWIWGVVPMIFSAWVNFHSSVIVGLAILGAHLAGRMIEIGWSARRVSVGTIVRDPLVWRWTTLTVLATLATLVNPVGLRVFGASLTLARNPNLSTVTEWLPMATTSLGGRLFAVSCALLAVVLRMSRRRIRPVEALMVGALAVGVLQSGRFIVWYVMVYLYAVMPHVAEIMNRMLPARTPVPRVEPEDLTARSFVYTLICLFFVWSTFALSHLTDRLLGAEPRPERTLYTPSTPRGLADDLIAHPPTGLVWNSQSLGDWITWAWIKHYGGEKPVIPLMTNTHMHLIPRQVWNDYQQLGVIRPGWDELLKKYAIDTLVISKLQHAALAHDIRKLPGWTIRYEDENGLIAVRSPEKSPKP